MGSFPETYNDPKMFWSQSTELSFFFSSTEFLGFKQAINQSLFLLTLAQKYITIMKILEVEIRVLAAWNNHGVSGARQPVDISIK